MHLSPIAAEIDFGLECTYSHFLLNARVEGSVTWNAMNLFNLHEVVSAIGVIFSLTSCLRQIPNDNSMTARFKRFHGQ